MHLMARIYPLARVARRAYWFLAAVAHLRPLPPTIRHTARYSQVWRCHSRFLSSFSVAIHKMERPATPVSTLLSLSTTSYCSHPNTHSLSYSPSTGINSSSCSPRTSCSVNTVDDQYSLTQPRRWRHNGKPYPGSSLVGDWLLTQ